MADPLPPRRVSSVAASSIPPPPPLPPSKDKPTSYFSRFVTQPLTSAAYGSRPPSAQNNRPDGGRPNPLVPRLPGIRAGSSQDASHKTGLDIAALDINRDRTHAILAGKEILKTVRVQDAKIVEDTNLRAAVINYAEHNTASHARQRDALGIHDVKWSHGQFNTHIATAAANGKVILYDLNRAGVELARLHEHARQVHKIAFNPHQGHLLLSASQDATVRLWDLREMRKDVMTCPSRDQYAGMSGGIRDVQWCPTDAVEFAFGTDNGIIQRWDFRMNKGPKQKITAHDQPCFAIDWHPDGKHLLSASQDRTVKLWDFSVNDRRQKPAYVLTTPYPVRKARWRPPYWSDEHYEKGVYQCTQLATSYDPKHFPVVHVWDFRRPNLPFREIHRFATAPSDMLWHSRDVLWTVGREGVFQQNDVHLVPKVVDRRNLQTFAVSPLGEIAAFAQKRPKRRRSGLEYSTTTTEDTYLGDARGDKRNSPEKTSLRSSADDSLDDSFLSSSLRRHHGRTASNRSAKSFGVTPPSDTAPKVMFLTDSMAIHNEAFKPNQIAFRGALPGAMNVQLFSYLAQKYKAIALPDPPTLQSFQNLHQIFEQNADYAQRAALYRLAETWRIVGGSIMVATRKRAELHRRRRVEHNRPAIPASSNVRRQSTSEQPVSHDVQSLLPANPAVRAILGTIDKLPAFHGTNNQHAANESTSNLATPLARPFTTSDISTSDKHQHVSHLPDPDREDAITLPPAIAGPHSGSHNSTGENISRRSEPDHQSLVPPQANHHSFNGPNWYQSSEDLDQRRAMIGSWRNAPRAPLSLEPPDAQGIDIRAPRLDRHDSDESFAMFSASTDSQRGTSMPSSFASGKSHSQGGMESIPEKWPHAPADSSFGNVRPTGVGNISVNRHTSGLDHLGKSVQISPTTLPIGKDEPPPGPKDQGVQLGSGRHGADQGCDESSREKAVHDIEVLRRNNQLLRHDSSESEAYASSRSELSMSMIDYNIEMEASGTIVPDVDDATKIVQGPNGPPGLPHASESAPPALDAAAADALVLSDFQAMHVDAEEGSAFSVIGLLNNILAFHTNNLSDAQTSSLLLLLLAPLLPQTNSLSETPEIDVAEVLSSFSETFTALGLTPTQAQTVISTQLTELIATGINPYQAEAILHTYHAQLHSLSLFNSAASLRRITYPTYPAVYEQALKDTQLGLLCLSCKSPINNPKDKMRCETCKRAQAPCPICWGRYPAFESVSMKKKAKAKLRSSMTDKEHRRKRSSLILAPSIEIYDRNKPSPIVPEVPSPPTATLWTWCPLCGHGGHTNCLSTWFSDPILSDGACATEGCLCDCVRGRRREEKIKEILRRKEEKDRARLVRKGDDWKVSESKAVSAVRGALGDSGGMSGQNMTAGPGSGVTMGGGGARRDEGRRVRVVVPQDDTATSTSRSQLLPQTTTGKMPKY